MLCASIRVTNTEYVGNCGVLFISQERKDPKLYAKHVQSAMARYKPSLLIIGLVIYIWIVGFLKVRIHLITLYFRDTLTRKLSSPEDRHLRECLCKSVPVDFAGDTDLAHFLCVVRHSCTYTKTTIRLIGSLYFSEFYGN